MPLGFKRLNPQNSKVVIFLKRKNHDILQVVRRWLLTVELQLQFWVSAIRSGLRQVSLRLPLFCPCKLFHNHLSPNSEVFDGPDQARHYFILHI